MKLRTRWLSPVLIALTATFSLAAPAAFAKPHSRPRCRAVLPLAAIAGGTGKTLEFSEWGPEPFLLGSGDAIARGHACDYSDPARAEFTVDPYAGYFKAAFEATPQQWNKLRTLYKRESTFKAIKKVDGARLFSVGPAVPVVPSNLSETGETSFIFGYTRHHNVFQVGITNAPIAKEAVLVAGIAERLDAEWLNRGKFN